MRIRTLFLLGAFALTPLALAGHASAKDTRAKASGYVLLFPDDVARFRVTRDLDTGTMVFTSTDPALLSEPPTILLRSSASADDIRVATVAVADQPGTWRVTHELLRSEPIEGSMVIRVGTKEHTAPLVLKAMRTPQYGGQLMSVCNGELEVVHNLSNGTLMIYADEGTKVAEPPIVALTEPQVSEVKLEAVAGKPNVWQAKSDLFKSPMVCGTLKANVDGKSCDSDIVFVGAHGGRIVKWKDGPRYEIVPETNTIYFVEETWNGKPYTIEEPVVMWGNGESARVVKLEPVAGEPRAYRLVGADARFTDPGDARLRMTLFGKTLETDLGVSGLHIGVR